MKIILVLLILIHSGPSLAQSKHILGSAEQEGLDKTQDLLRNKSERDKFIRTSPAASDIDRKVDKLTGGGAEKEEVYDIAARVMEKVAQEAKGDPELMKQLLLKASANPKGFYETYFSEEDRRRVKKIADSIDKKQGPAAPQK